MKTYIKPVFICVELRAEERLAGSGCIIKGSCYTANEGCNMAIQVTHVTP